MSTKIEILIEMQKCDDIIGKMESLMQELPQKLHSMKENLAVANAQLEDTKKLLDENLKRQKLKELEIKENNEKIDKYKNQLLTIQTNKEYKALNSEVNHLENKNTKIDDDIIELMEEEAVFRSQMEDEKKVKEKAEAELAANEQKIEKEIQEVEKKIKEIKEKRNTLAQGLPKTMVKRYAALIKSKDRKAVVFEENGSCSGCHYMIRPQLIIEINNGKTIVSCESCGRMLVAKPQN